MPPLLLTLLLVQPPAEIHGTVTHVHDGDTVHVTRADGEVVKVRFMFCDAPEIDQPHGVEARDYVKAQCLGKPVTVIDHGRDEYGRTLGEVLVAGESLNKAVIKNGHGWWFYHYNPDPALGLLEVEARAAKKGLFAADAPLYPRAWRRGARIPEPQTDTSDSPIRIMALLPDPAGVDDGNETVTLSNNFTADVPVDGWQIADSEGAFPLSGTIPAGGTRTFRLDAAVKLGNGGDTIVLKKPDGAEAHKATYTAAKRGTFVLVAP